MPHMAGIKNYNWTSHTYIDESGKRHADPYMVLVLKPKVETKTAPTYPDVIDIFLDQMLTVEAWNDAHLKRPSQLVKAILEVEKILEKHKQSLTVISGSTPLVEVLPKWRA